MMKPASRTCAECGQTYTALRAHSEFCGAACRKAFNNRRMTRGAELYDLFMAVRYERDEANAAHVWSNMCKLAADYRVKDEAERGGRRSWGDWKGWLRNNPWLAAVVITRNAIGRRA